MASQPVHLYYWPTSFYSQKVLTALDEKRVKYSSTVISLIQGEQNTPSYLRCNPEGKVPMLKVGEKYISDSENIFDTVETLNNAPVLIPNPSTPEGALVKQWRTRLSNINIEGLTFGIILNPDLAVGPTKIPASYKMTKEDYNKNLEKTIAKLEGLKEKNPDLQAALDKKIELSKKKPAMMEKSVIVGILEELEGIFDDIEAQLRKSRTENIVEHWLCGPSFTVADITLCVTIGRLDLVGLQERYLNPERRPALVEYWNQAARRPSVQKCIVGAMKNLKQYMVKNVLTKVATGAAVAGGVLALGIFIGHKVKS